MDSRLKADRWIRRKGRRRRRRLALLLAILVLLALAVVALRPRAHIQGGPQAATQPGHPKKGDLLRAGAAWSSADVAKLQHDLAVVTSDQAFPASTGLLVIDGRSGRLLYTRNASLPLVPGSTIKLITAAAALSALGADHRFTTSIVTDGMQDGSALNGSIWLVGGGDPELTSDELRSGVRALQLGGIGRVSGNVYADGSRYGPDLVSGSWLSEDLKYGWAAPASALSIDGDSVAFTITPRAGSEADVAVDPPGQRVIASVSTVSADADNTLKIDVLPNDAGYEVRGQIPYGAPQQYWRAVPHPTRGAAISFLAMLQLAGVAVSGSASDGTAPTHTTVLWQHRSRTLDQIIKHMFFLSDNHYAEELLRAVGWKATGLGSLDNSLAATRSFMQARDIPVNGVALADGSGLSTQNKVTAAALAAALRFILNQPLAKPPFTLLPRAGMEGTVSVRHLAPEAKGRVYAKDGYIDSASSLAGYVLTAHHGPVIFAFLANDWQHGLDAVWAKEDEMLDAISRY